MKPLRNPDFWVFSLKNGNLLPYREDFTGSSWPSTEGLMPPWLSTPPVSAQSMPTSPYMTPCAIPQGFTLRMKSREFWHNNYTTELTSPLRARGGCPSIPSHLLPSECILAIQGGKASRHQHERPRPHTGLEPF